MHKNRYRKLTLELCKEAVIDCFKGKWRRNDVLTFIEKYAGIPRIDIKIDDLSGNWTHKNEAVDAIALMLLGTVEDVVDEGIEPDDMEEVHIRERPDGMTGKVREIAMLCIMHQLLGHIEALMLMPLFKARLLPTQHASIPGHGQTMLKDQMHRYFLKESLGIRYVRKTDVVHAYATLKYSVCINLVKEEIPNAKYAIGLLEYLADNAPGGHLIIGGYIDAWLFNFAMSYAIRYMYSLGTTRRGKKIPYVIRCGTFMDDFAICGSSAKGVQRAVNALNKWFREKQGLELKETSGIIKLMTIKEEKGRRNLESASQRGVSMLDMAGYRISRTHVTIRKRVFKRARRQLLKGYRELQETGTLRRGRAKKIIAYNGYIKQSDSFHLKEKYHVEEIIEMANRVNSFYGWLDNKKRMEELHVLQRYRFGSDASESGDRESSGRQEDGKTDGQCGGVHAGGRENAEDVPF